MDVRRAIAALLLCCAATFAHADAPLLAYRPLRIDEPARYEIALNEPAREALADDTLFALLNQAATSVAEPTEVAAVDDATIDDALERDTLLSDAAATAEVVAEPTATSDAIDADGNESVWLVNTRTIPGLCYSGQALNWHWSRYDCGAGWQTASWDDFQASDDPQVTTVILIHGYRHSQSDARNEGLITWRRLRSQCCDKRLRMVVWSWPTEPCSRRPVEDVSAKACRAELDARLLAFVVAKINPQVRVSIIGYSLGGRVCCGALHLLGGGTLAGRPLDAELEAREAPLRSILVAAAVDEDWLMPNRRYGLAVSTVDRMAIFINPHDMVLHHYRLLAQRGSVGAIGYRGPSGVYALGEDAKKIFMRNVNGEMHRRHGWTYYLASGSLMSCICREALFIDLDAVKSVTSQTARSENVAETAAR